MKITKQSLVSMENYRPVIYIFPDTSSERELYNVIVLTLGCLTFFFSIIKNIFYIGNNRRSDLSVQKCKFGSYEP